MSSATRRRRRQFARSACLAALAALLVDTPALTEEPPIPLSADLRITANATVAAGTYRIADPENDGAVVIVGNNITIDFQGATLRGAPETAPADEFTGRGLVIHGRNITIRNANVHGYKVGIFAEDAPGLTLDACDVSRNYRQRLKSTLRREDLSDWLYGHENDDSQWLRYGAGIYLLNCPRATVRNCVARNGQNGLCLVRCDEAYAVDNDMSYMSGWGFAMWRSSRCNVFNNRFDFCIRGYSHGVYSRGQDSAGILVYEQCHDNVFAFNSATHGGDGFFLYAGNDTLQKTGAGGCNDNLVYRNNFSDAAANGIEATFSSGNRFIENTLDECEHGVWAGYSFDTMVAGNMIRHSRSGVSIEHGRRNRIVSNTIEDAKLGVHLWWDDDKDLLASAFGKAHDGCPSADNTIVGNRFLHVDTAVRLQRDTGTRVVANTFTDVKTPLDADGASPISSDTDTSVPKIRLTAEQRTRIDAHHETRDAFLPEDARRGRKFIFVDQWGPYDFSDTRLWPEEIFGSGTAELQLLAPKATRFRVTSVTGPADIEPREGVAPQRLTVSCAESGVHHFTTTIDVGDKHLHASGVLTCATWRISYYQIKNDEDPREAEVWARILARPPLDTASANGISFAWGYKSPAPKVPADRFATVAETELEIPAGRWRLATISDDGVRVVVDGREVFANWTHHGPTPDEATIELTAGPHGFRVEHFELDGYAQLELQIQPEPGP